MRAMNDANSQMYVDLLSLLEGYFDVRLWSPDSKRVFSMKSFYGVLTGDNVSLLNESYLWRIPRVLAFAGLLGYKGLSLLTCSNGAIILG